MNNETRASLEKGLVVSDKMNKTLVVLVEYRKIHPRFAKYIKRSKKFFVHDENSLGKIGDNVIFRRSRPISKKKSYNLEKIL